MYCRREFGDTVHQDLHIILEVDLFLQTQRSLSHLVVRKFSNKQNLTGYHGFSAGSFLSAIFGICGLRKRASLADCCARELKHFGA